MQGFIFFCLLIIISGCQTSVSNSNSMPTSIDWQGHRGARGLAPENTIPAFLKALEFPSISTLELDVVVSKDQQLVVSHEPWFSHQICKGADGQSIPEEEERSFAIYHLNLDAIQTFDCGSLGNPRFPEQEALFAVKPSLGQVAEAVRQYCKTNQRPLPRYNIELKAEPAWDNVLTPPPAEFVRLALQQITQAGIREQSCIQSFDLRILREVKRQQPDMTLALLIENKLGVEKNLEALGFIPDIYSPYYPLITPTTTDSIHQKGMKLIPWTVNETATMQRLLGLGVDGIITDYPNRIPQ
jgi:glycerophosphoryl diester phosphodiesterase